MAVYIYKPITVLGVIRNIRLVYSFQCHIQNFNYDENDQITKLGYFHMELEKKGLREGACSQLIKTHDTLSRIFFIKHADFL